MSRTFGSTSTATEVATAFSDRIKGRSVLVTGVSPNGLGAETVRVIVNAGAALVICASRTPSKVQEVFACLKEEQPQANVRFLKLDLTSLDSVRSAAREVLRYKEPVHVIINNAGLMGQYRKLNNGLESTFGANHIGHFVFTNMIIPKMIKNAQSDPTYKPRIVNVSSRGHWASPVRFDDLDFKDGKDYTIWAAYGQSKTANILYTKSLSERLEQHGILCFSLHPGVIFTDLIREVTHDQRVKAGIIDENGNTKDEYTNSSGAAMKVKTIGQGAATHIFTAFSPDIEGHSGAYLADCQLSEDVAEYAASKENADRLWSLSEQIVGEKYDFGP